VLQGILSFLGVVVGMLTGSAVKAFGGETIPGQYVSVFEFLGGAAGFLVVYILWDPMGADQVPKLRGKDDEGLPALGAAFQLPLRLVRTHAVA
jgi:hypothetical protein